MNKARPVIIINIREDRLIESPVPRNNSPIPEDIAVVFEMIHVMALELLIKPQITLKLPWIIRLSPSFASHKVLEHREVLELVLIVLVHIVVRHVIVLITWEEVPMDLNQVKVAHSHHSGPSVEVPQRELPQDEPQSADLEEVPEVLP